MSKSILEIHVNPWDPLKVWKRNSAHHLRDQSAFVADRYRTKSSVYWCRYAQSDGCD